MPPSSLAVAPISPPSPRRAPPSSHFLLRQSSPKGSITNENYDAEIIVDLKNEWLLRCLSPQLPSPVTTDTLPSDVSQFQRGVPSGISNNKKEDKRTHQPRGDLHPSFSILFSPSAQCHAEGCHRSPLTWVASTAAVAAPLIEAEVMEKNTRWASKASDIFCFIESLSLWEVGDDGFHIGLGCFETGPKTIKRTKTIRLGYDGLANNAWAWFYDSETALNWALLLKHANMLRWVLVQVLN